jgi:CheY-like chemotaxis protein
MTKIMLVEDDNNLREIYEARLAAEGFDIVSAEDGEAALALAAKEHPDLVITDVMMPKISGFEMLDILRNTEALRDVKVIMLTALGQAEDNARAGALGANRYLVKSQVTLEDIVKATHDVLEGDNQPMQSNAAPAIAPAPDTTELAVPQDGQPWKVEDSPVQASVPVPDPQSVNQDIVDLDLVSGTVVTAPAAQSTDQPADVTAESEAIVSNGGTVSFPPVINEPAEAAQTAGNTDEHVDLPQTPSIPMDPEFSSEQAEETSTEGISQTNSSVDETTESPADTQQPADTPQFDVSAQSETADAEPAAEEESQMRSQIDQFLNDNTPAAAATTSDSTPADDSTVTNLAAVTTDDSQPTGTAGSNDDGQIVMASPPPDEDEAEYAKDASTPDMGQLAVHAEPTSQPQAGQDQTVPGQAPDAVQAPAETAAAQPAAVAAEPPVEPTPGYPSQAYNLPTVPGAAVGDTPPPVGPAATVQPQGDGIISNAINDMIASTAPNQLAQPDPVQAANTQITASGPAALPEQPAAAQDAPSAPVSETQPPTQASAPANDYQGGGSMRSHIIAPLNLAPKPDINQLLSMEEAKAAAQAAGANVQPLQPGQSQQQNSQPAQPAAQQGWQPGQAWAPPTSNQYVPPVDPNSISL